MGSDTYLFLWSHLRISSLLSFAQTWFTARNVESPEQKRRTPFCVMAHALTYANGVDATLLR